LPNEGNGRINQDVMDETAGSPPKPPDQKKIGMAVAVIVLLCLICWLNRFRYERIGHTGSPNYGWEKIVRINRFTEQICYSQDNGLWSQYIVHHTKPGAISIPMDGSKPVESDFMVETDDCNSREGVSPN
jgi:hypothetical protein